MGFNFYDNKDEYHVQLKMQELHGLLFEFLESKNIPIFIYLAMVQLKIENRREYRVIALNGNVKFLAEIKG